jgi:hypothetical protein
MLKSILLLFMVVPQTSSFYRLFYTNRDATIGKYDCLVFRDETSNNFDKEYCRRPLDSWHFVNIDQQQGCLENIVTFDEMRTKGITSENPLASFAPIDIIDQYQVYLGNWNITKMNKNKNIFCNCSDPKRQAFGRNCEYMFRNKLTAEELYKYSTPSKRTDNIYNIRWNYMIQNSEEKYRITNGTCYTGLPKCRTFFNVCLQWNQICDGE